MFDFIHFKNQKVVIFESLRVPFLNWFHVLRTTVKNLVNFWLSLIHVNSLPFWHCQPSHTSR
jgi:hypothetical protein